MVTVQDKTKDKAQEATNPQDAAAAPNGTEPKQLPADTPKTPAKKRERANTPNADTAAAQPVQDAVDAPKTTTAKRGEARKPQPATADQDADATDATPQLEAQPDAANPSAVTVEAAGRQTVWVALEDIDDNPWQPRTARNDAAQEELVESIDQVGILQQPTLRPKDGRYQTAWGHRRINGVRELAGAGRAQGRAWKPQPDGRPCIEVFVEEFSDEEMRIIALTENTKREDLTQLEQYIAYRRYLDEVPDASITSLAKRVGLDRSTLSHGLRILTLPEFVLEAVVDGTLAFGVAREFLCLECEAAGFHRDVAKSVLADLKSSGHDVTRRRVRQGLAEYGRSSVYRWRDQPSLASLEPAPTETFADRADGMPRFDVEAFQTAHPKHMHDLPHWHDWQKPTPYTCAVREWNKLQKAACREKDRAAGKNEPPPVRELWQKHLTKHPALAEYRKAHKADTLQGPPTKPELEALGTLGLAPVSGTNNKLDFIQEIRRMPEYVDTTECVNTCTKGARYVDWHGRLEFSCTNQACFNVKSDEGLSVANVLVAERFAADEVQCERIAAAASTSPHWTHVVATIINDAIHMGYTPLYSEHYGDDRVMGLAARSAARARLVSLLPQESYDAKRNGPRLWPEGKQQEGFIALVMRLAEFTSSLNWVERAVAVGVAQATAEQGAPETEANAEGDAKAS